MFKRNFILYLGDILGFQGIQKAISVAIPESDKVFYNRGLHAKRHNFIV